MEEISFELVGKVLEQDITSDLNILLLKKGTVLTETNILLLKKHNYKAVKVSEDGSFKTLYLRHLKQVEDLFTDFHTSREWFDKEEYIVRKVQRDVFYLEELYLFEDKSNLYRHSANVGLLAFFLGKLLRYSYKNKLLLWQMGLLHDIGKLKLKVDIVNKKVEELTVEEFQEYRQHPEFGWNLLKGMNGVNVMMLNAARHHHEHIDGSGFPKGINVKYLPVMVQIITVANKIDHVMSTNTNIFNLLNELMEEVRGNKLNPAIVVPFVKYLLRSQLGRKVLLNDGTKCEIVYIFEQEPSQPLLSIEDENSYLDLRKHHKLKIVSSV
ncbi:HD domain-containing protein [Anaerobacillus alkaliphilus]|uniref:HD domain-containing protein n=1 Tax=Anaerobacillus alkaliphilus TaxID=1548597 RepID=A0A4Q0VSQ0_9BACI|nr:HD domain-containing phosphohydrolase [Anaerobacillus alkaliphilus]RXI99832.1 HD domain-containing protein [Anaerobacillus alkaliphilus]